MPLLNRHTSKSMAGLVAEVVGFVDKTELDSSSTTYFTVQCTKEGSSWSLEKRYSDFHGFEGDLRTQVEISAPFPPKLVKLVALSHAQKEERRVAMDKWVGELLRQPLTSTVLAQTYNFFGKTPLPGTLTRTRLQSCVYTSHDPRPRPCGFDRGERGGRSGRTGEVLLSPRCLGS